MKKKLPNGSWVTVLPKDDSDGLEYQTHQGWPVSGSEPDNAIQEKVEPQPYPIYLVALASEKQDMSLINISLVVPTRHAENILTEAKHMLRKMGHSAHFESIRYEESIITDFGNLKNYFDAAAMVSNTLYGLYTRYNNIKSKRTRP